MDDFSGWIGTIFAILTFVVGWFVKQARDRAGDKAALLEIIQKNKDEANEKIQGLQLKLAASYHDKGEFREILDRSMEPVLDFMKEMKQWIVARDARDQAASAAHGGSNGRSHG